MEEFEKEKEEEIKKLEDITKEVADYVNEQKALAKKK
jgi:hypothetical protein